MRNISFLVTLASAVHLLFSPQLAMAAPNTPTASTSRKPPISVTTAPAPTEVSPTIRPEYDHGPRAGFMRGKKDVQSELLLGPGSGIRLYFVDAQWIDLPLKDTSLKVFLKSKGLEGEGSPLTCTLGADVYSCALPKGVAFTVGDSLEVKLATSRDSPEEYTFRYTFPFQSAEH